jgi:hypothetical protein
MQNIMKKNNIPSIFIKNIGKLFANCKTIILQLLTLFILNNKTVFYSHYNTLLENKIINLFLFLFFYLILLEYYMQNNNIILHNINDIILNSNHNIIKNKILKLFLGVVGYVNNANSENNLLKNYNNLLLIILKTNDDSSIVLY